LLANGAVALLEMTQPQANAALLTPGIIDVTAVAVARTKSCSARCCR
jgi:succinylglutamic semialdehyde dehydrogenase